MMNKLLIPALRQYMHNDGKGFVCAYDSDETNKVVDALCAKVSELEKQSDWISVDDKKPSEVETQYICYIPPNEDGHDLVIALLWDGEFWAEYDGGGINWTDMVTHWMPLPNPPAQ